MLNPTYLFVEIMTDQLWEKASNCALSLVNEWDRAISKFTSSRDLGAFSIKTIHLTILLDLAGFVIT